MSSLKFVLIILLLPLIGYAQVKTSDGSNTIEERIKAFSEASDFFFATLSENFEGNRGENMYLLMQIFSSPKEEPEDFFRLHINSKKFKALNDSLKHVYNNFFPFHIYNYEKVAEYKNRVLSNHTRTDICDTIQDIIPTNMPCYVPRNTFVEGYFKHSFAKQLLSDKTDSKVKSELLPLLDFNDRHSALNFSFDFSKKFNAKQLNEIYDIEYNRILTSLVFWEYLADCANYDLNTRKYFYENQSQ